MIGVASYDNVETTSASFRVSPDGEQIAYSPAAGALGAPTEGSLPMSRTGTPASAADACTVTGALPELDGTAALFKRGGCTFYEKSINAQYAGAEAVVIYNNVPGGLNPSVAPPSADDPPVAIPVVAVTQDDGILLEHPVRNLTFDVHEANEDGTAGRKVHRLFSTAFEVDYVGRNGTANRFTAYGWDGTVSLTERHNRNRTLRNGEYVMRLTVLKSLGDPSNADHVETWDSSVITIDRPRGVRPMRPGRP